MSSVISESDSTANPQRNDAASASRASLTRASDAGLWLTQRAGLFVGESCLQWMPWMRCLCTSSSADGSVHKWSAVFILVYSSAQGPTGEMKGNGYINAPLPVKMRRR